MHVSSLLHIPIIHLAFHTLLSPPLHPADPAPPTPPPSIHPSIHAASRLLLFPLLLSTALRLSASSGTSRASGVLVKGLQGHSWWPSRCITLNIKYGNGTFRHLTQTKPRQFVSAFFPPCWRFLKERSFSSNRGSGSLYSFSI